MPVDIDREARERELVRKFVATWQLNVPERNSIPSNSLPGSLLVAEICTTVKDKGWYPVDWRPDDGFDGGLIERLDADRCRLYWKIECGVSRFALQEVSEFDSLLEGAREYAVRFFGTSFDNIQIDWER